MSNIRPQDCALGLIERPACDPPSQACLQKELVRSWRVAFASPAAAFVGIQLPDYYDPKDPGTPGTPGYATAAEGVFSMRLAHT
jgi:hypothetical protein